MPGAHHSRRRGAVVAIAAAVASAATPAVAHAAELNALSAGQGTILISPGPDGKDALCRPGERPGDPDSGCGAEYPDGTSVRLTAIRAEGRRFAGWSDFACRDTLETCTITLSGTTYITARFTPVTLSVDGTEFGAITVRPAPGGYAGAAICMLAPDANPCTYDPYPIGTTVTLRRAHDSPGLYWIGACDGNANGNLDADVCRLTLWGDESVGAGFEDLTAHRPPIGTGLTVVKAGNGRGTVKGKVKTGPQTLDCGRRCTITGASRNDQVRLTAKEARGSRFLGWSDNRRAPRTRSVSLSKITRIRVTFGRARRSR